MLGRLGISVRSVAGGELQRAAVAACLLTAYDGLGNTLVPPYLQSVGFGVADIGLLVTVWAIACLASRFPAGSLADGSRARRWFLAACLVCTVTAFLYGFAQDAWLFTLVRGTSGLAFGLATTLNFATFLASTTPRDRARAISLYTAAASAGYTIGNLAAGVLGDLFGFPAAFAACAVFSLGAMAVPPRSIERSAAQEAPVPAESIWSGLKKAEVRAIPLFGLSLSFMHQTVGVLFPLYVLAAGESLTVVGVAKGLQSFANTFARPLGGPLIAAFGMVLVGCVGAALNGTFIAIIPFVSGAIPLVLIAGAVGLARALGVVANAYNTAEVSARGLVRRGTASALLQGGQDLAGIVAPIFAGFTAAQLGLGTAMQVLAAGAAIVSLTVMLTARRSLSARAAGDAAVR